MTYAHGLCDSHYHKARYKPKEKLAKIQCRSCSGFFTPARKSQVCCSTTCRERIRRGCKARDEVRSHVCDHCGVSYRSASVKETIYCSSKCKRAAWAKANPASHAANRRIDGATRRARKRNATVEQVDPFKVFLRDKWHCQDCGVSTPPSKRGTYEDEAPELDHIKPLSKGGDHSYQNTQCLCRRCNQKKSDTWQPQGEESLLQA